MRESVLEKALSNLAGEGGEFVPVPLANFFCKMVYDGSDIMSMITNVPMTTKTLTIPSITSKLQVYWQSLEKGETPRSAFTTASKELDAETWMAWVDFSDQLRDDIQAGPFNVQGLLADAYAAAMAYYLELAIILGDVAHAATTTTDPGNAGDTWYTAGTWYSADPRLMWDGLLTIALASGNSFAATTANSLLAFTADAIAANVTNPTRMSAEVVDYAVYKMGKYARKSINNRASLFLVMSPFSMMQLQNDTQVITIDKFGPNATIVKGEVQAVKGVPVIASPFMTDGYAVMTYRANALYGDRQGIRVEDERVPRELGTNKVVSMRGDFTVCNTDAVVLITDLETPAAS